MSAHGDPPGSNGEEGDPLALATELRDELVGRARTVATAESLTGGGLGALLTAPAGASAVYLGGVVAYATAVKRDMLGVRQPTIERGVVSADCAEQMARGLRALLGPDYAVSTTGVAGPDEQDGMPVGTLFVGVAGPWGTAVRRLDVPGERHTVRRRACLEALHVILDTVRGDPE